VQAVACRCSIRRLFGQHPTTCPALFFLFLCVPTAELNLFPVLTDVTCTRDVAGATLVGSPRSAIIRTIIDGAGWSAPCRAQLRWTFARWRCSVKSERKLRVFRWHSVLCRRQE